MARAKAVKAVEKPVVDLDAERAVAFEAVLDGMAEGKTVEEAMRGVVVGGKGWTAGAMRRWIADDEARVAQYQRMKRLLAQAWAEEAIQIARESTNQSATVDRVLIDTLKWAASKANPAEYGERQTVEHQGAQNLTVKIVEDEVPVRNAGVNQTLTQATGNVRATVRSGETIRALEGAMMTSVLSAGNVSVAGGEE